MNCGYGPGRSPDGAVIQSAVHRPTLNDRWQSGVWGEITRAVVLNVYFADDSGWQSWSGNGVQRGIACDVRTYGLRSRVLKRVPVLQRSHGLWDEDVYVPRAARQSISGGTMVTVSSSSGPSPTVAEDLDADHVLVGFLDCNPTKPVILPFTMGHPQSRRRVVGTDGHCRRIRINGSLLEWDKEGNITIDASGAAKEEFGVNGTEVSNSGVGGKVILKTKDGGGATVRLQLDCSGNVVLEDGGATESLVFTKTAQNAKLKAGLEVDIEAPMVKVGTSLQLAEVCGNTDAMVKGTSYMIAHNLVIAALVAWLQALKVPLFDVAVAGVTETLLTAITGFQTTAAVPGGLVSLKAKVG